MPTTKNQFTPGPYRVVAHGEARFSILSDGNSNAIKRWIDKGGSGGFADSAITITELHTTINGSGKAYGPRLIIDDEEVEANAYLLAAAPALFAALQEIQNLSANVRNLAIKAGHGEMAHDLHCIAGALNDIPFAVLALAQKEN